MAGLEVKNRKKVGLALGSGGWKGLSHVGVIKALVENNIPIDFIAGSSAGALIGGMYAALGDIYKVEKIINEFNKRDLFAILADSNLKMGVLKGDKAVRFIEKAVGKMNIEDLKIPFCAVATDLLRGEPVYLNKGNLSTAIKASGSIPILFEPSNHEDRFLIDGGATEMIPTEAVRSMGADIVIGANVYSNTFPITEFLDKKKKLAKTQIAFISYGVLLNRLAHYCAEKADVVIEPEIPQTLKNGIGIKWFLNFIGEKKVIKYGEEATLKVIPKIKELIYS